MDLRINILRMFEVSHVESALCEEDQVHWTCLSDVVLDYIADV